MVLAKISEGIKEYLGVVREVNHPNVFRKGDSVCMKFRRTDNGEACVDFTLTPLEAKSIAYMFLDVAKDIKEYKEE